MLSPTLKSGGTRPPPRPPPIDARESLAYTNNLLINIAVRQIMCACSSYIHINKQEMKRRKLRLKTENATKQYISFAIRFTDS